MRKQRNGISRGGYSGTRFWSLGLFSRRIFYWQGDSRKDGEGNRWRIGWTVLPRLYLLAAKWHNRYSTELKLQLEIGSGTPPRRQAHWNYTVRKTERRD